VLDYRQGVELERQWISDTWSQLLGEGALNQATTVLFVVSGEHNLSRAEAAYLSPNGYELSYEVLRAVGEQRLHDVNGLHRFALFQGVADGPLHGFVAMLRHELRHAEQFHEFGPGLFELDGHLRAALGVGLIAAERERYESIPIEYDANRVAAAYVRAQDGDALAEIGADERFAAYSRDYDAWDDDLLERTLAAVSEHADLDSDWNGQPLSVDIAAQYDHARQWNTRDRAFDSYNPTRDGDGIVFL
jgi:hypothetical protein